MAIILYTHKAPTPEPAEEPIPVREPEPEDDPAPHPDPVLRRPDEREEARRRLEELQTFGQPAGRLRASIFGYPFRC